MSGDNYETKCEAQGVKYHEHNAAYVLPSDSEQQLGYAYVGKLC